MLGLESTMRATLNLGRVPQLFRRLGEIARKPMDGVRGRRVLRRVRGVIAEEFASGRGFGAGGGQQTWRATREFGTRPATRPPLGGPGSALGQAWQGGPGGFQSFGPNVVRFGIALPYARVHREGASIGVTPKMRAFVRHAFGVHFRANKRTVEIPARPHADMRAPRFVEAARGAIVEAIAEATA